MARAEQRSERLSARERARRSGDRRPGSIRRQVSIVAALVVCFGLLFGLVADPTPPTPPVPVPLPADLVASLRESKAITDGLVVADLVSDDAPYREATRKRFDNATIEGVYAFRARLPEEKTTRSIVAVVLAGTPSESIPTGRGAYLLEVKTLTPLGFSHLGTPASPAPSIVVATPAPPTPAPATPTASPSPNATETKKPAKKTASPSPSGG